MSWDPATPFIPPLPSSRDSSPQLAFEHPPVIPTTPPNWNQSVSNEGGNTLYPDLPYPNYSPIFQQLSPIEITPSIPLLFENPPRQDSAPELAPEHPPVIPTTTPDWNESVSIEEDNTPYRDSTYPNYSPIIRQLSPIKITPSISPLPSSPPRPDNSPELAPKHSPVIPTTTSNWNKSISIEEGNSRHPDSPYPTIIPPLSPIVITPSISPLPSSPPRSDSSPELTPEHPPVIPTTSPTTPNRTQSVSIEGNASYPDSPYPNYSPNIPLLKPIVTPSPPGSVSGSTPTWAASVPSWVTNPPVDYSKVSDDGSGFWPREPINSQNSSYVPHPNYLSPYGYPSQLSNISYEFLIEPPSRPNSVLEDRYSESHDDQNIYTAHNDILLTSSGSLPKTAPELSPIIPEFHSNWGGNTSRRDTSFPVYGPSIPQTSPTTTPSIPSLPTSSDSSPEPPPLRTPAPVIPVTTPFWNQYAPIKESYTTYPAYQDYTPFIPPQPLSPTPSGVIPDTFPPPQTQPESRRHVSSEGLGYPQDPTVAPQHSFSRTESLPRSPYSPYSVPSGYQGFNTPWVSNTAQLPSTPWAAPQRFSQGFSPAFSSYGPPPPLPGWPGAATGFQQFYSPQYPSPWITTPSRFEPSKPPDCMDPFMEGKGYGAVLDPFLIQVLGVNVRINPLITPLLEAESDRVHLIWNMLFPTSMVQRSIDPPHISWMKDRDAPATFPRISSLSIVSDTIPWVLNVKAKDDDIGVTCGEVIDSIGQELTKFSYKRDYTHLTPSLRYVVSETYYRNRSRDPGVPGGRLGQGMKRLDFLCQDTMFAGIEINDDVVKRVCGEALPCVFVLKCSKASPTEQEAGDHKAKLKTNKIGSRLRSRAKSQLKKLWYIFRVPPRQAP